MSGFVIYYIVIILSKRPETFLPENLSKPCLEQIFFTSMQINPARIVNITAKFIKLAVL